MLLMTTVVVATVVSILIAMSASTTASKWSSLSHEMDALANAGGASG